MAAEGSGEIAAALARGAIVLTGTQRAARTLRRDAAHQRRASPDPMLVGTLSGALLSGDVLSWDAWVAGAWQGLLLDGYTTQTLLNGAQEGAIWREIIAADPAVSALRDTDAVAKMAAGAWAALAQYRGLSRLPGSATNADTEAFTAWALRFDERCRAAGYLPPARLEAALRRAVLAGALTLPPGRELFLVGFGRVLPARQALLDALEERGVCVTVGAEPQSCKNPQLYPAPDPATELRAAAAWAREIVAANPASSVAIVVPNLRERQPEIHRVFRDILAPEAQAIGSASDALPFEFSATRSLAEAPVAAAALDLLSWIAAPLPLERASHLLLSPFFAGGAEASVRAEFDAFDLRTARLLRPEIALEWLFARAARSSRRARMPALLAALQRMGATLRRSFAEPHAYGDWAERVREFLEAAGWAAGPLDSVAFQVRRKWDIALDELATLDFEGARVPFTAAREALQRIAAETTFAPESRNAPVQILRPEESAGLRFDALWFLGAGDLEWPAQSAAQPLLPWPLRRELGIPGADLAAEAAYAARVSARCAACASHVVFSYAAELSAGRQRPSAALASLALMPYHFVDATPSAPLALELEPDLLPLPPLPDRPIPGGATVLKDQAACAFRAFAAHRLFAAEPESREPGLNPRERGTVLHGVLEQFWAVIQTQAALHALTPAARRDALNTAIDLAFARTDAISAWDAAYLDTQRKRLLSLGLHWLEIESRRQIPFTVAAREAETRDVAIGPLRLSLRLDRVDHTAEGLVLIDYKTGSEADPSAWLSDRPDEPQLPLYAVLAAGEALHAVAFARVRAGKEMALTGYESTPGTLDRVPKKAPELEGQIERWYDVLTALANGFAHGEASVRPKKYPLTCQFCAHRPLCRLDPSAHLRDDQDDEELLRLEEARA